ncbi:MAG: 50S ribosomal protein L31 [bacterium]|nr:50S ribosomal protein L31 [bacterium]
MSEEKKVTKKSTVKTKNTKPKDKEQASTVDSKKSSVKKENISKSAAKHGLISEKKGIKYYKVKASCVCGAEYETGSTMDKIRIDICSNCHPFFTGENRIVDAEGRVDKFKKKYNLS